MSNVAVCWGSNVLVYCGSLVATSLSCCRRWDSLVSFIMQYQRKPSVKYIVCSTPFVLCALLLSDPVDS